MNKHKISSIVLVFAMILSAFSFSVVYSSETPGITVVSDFSGETLYEGANGNSVSQSNTVGYGESTNSLCWKMSAETPIAMDLGYNWKNYSTVSVRFKGEEAGLNFNIIFMDTPAKPWGKYKKYAAVTTGEWQEMSFPISEILFVINSIKGQTAVGGILLNANGWGITDYSKHKNIYFDSIWLTSSEYGKPISAPVCSIPYGAGYVEPDLDGTNSLSFEFETDIFQSDDISEAFRLYEVNGENETLSDAGFGVNVSDNIITVTFDENLKSSCVYKAVLDSSKIFSVGGGILEEDFETVFSVGMGSVIFSSVSSNPENNSENIEPDEGFVWQIDFNNDLSFDIDLNDYITVYENSSRLFEGVNFDVQDKTLSVTFDKNLDYSTKYKLMISEDFIDAYGNKITGDKEFSFVTKVEKKESSDVKIFSASNPTHMSAIVSRGAAVENATNLNINSKNAKISFETKDKSSYMTKDEIVITEGLKYLNLWLYSPKVTENKCNVVLYPGTDTGTAYYRHEVNVDWEGWKLVTLDIGSKPSIKSVMINFNGWQNLWPEGGYMLVDEIWYSADIPLAPYLVDSSFSDGYDKALVTGERLVMSFSGLSEVQNNAVIKITDSDGNEFNDFTCEFSGDDLIVNFGTFSMLTQYKITVNGLAGEDTVIQTEPCEITFTTLDGGIYADDFAFSKTSLESSSGLEFTAKVTNMNSSPQKVKVYVAAINADGCLTDIVSEEYKIDSEASSVKASLAEIPSLTAYVKAWIEDEDGYIISNKYLTLLSSVIENMSDKLKGSAPKAEIKSFDVNLRTLTLKGNISGVSDSMVAEISAPDGNVISKDIITVSQDGSFSCSIRLGKDAPSGIYNAKVYHGAAISLAAAGYMSETDCETLLSLANGSNSDKLYDFLKENSKILGIDDVSEERLLELPGLITEKDEFKSYQEVAEIITKTVSCFDLLNECLWSELADFIISNEYILFEKNSKDIKYFKSLTSKAKNEICRELSDSMPFESITDFRKDFSDAISEYEDSKDDEKESGKGSSGGGGGGGKVSGSVTIGGQISTPPAYTPIESLEVFTDLSDHEWARESIMNLYAEGIISPASDKKFRPSDNITREEFVKLIVEAFFKDKISSDEAMFTDAKTGAWYNKYLNAAKTEGIITGKTDGSFGAGESITREDMATIASRALEILGTDMSSSDSAGFTDSKYISDYALGYVNALSEKGVISGMGDGSFAPKSNATRAQAAKIIAGLVKNYR